MQGQAVSGTYRSNSLLKAGNNSRPLVCTKGRRGSAGAGRAGAAVSKISSSSSVLQAGKEQPGLLISAAPQAGRDVMY